ncbi:protein Hook homolog 2-like [Dicentrarchus labrax]|uniref:protein Hook homolog 2-like n=1 Tax=Dicentrarchus labrax TaxID=13489 RepID=UPI0021F55103|nr:protein Hook homolog 2-like [Dicentrarchus labrax]
MTSHREATLAAAPEDTQTDNTRSRQEQEEKLILTAWQSMSSALQQHSLSENSRAPGLAQSFLSKQRQSTQARRALSPRLQPR